MIKRDLRLPTFGGEDLKPLEGLLDWSRLVGNFRNSDKLCWTVVNGKVVCEADVDTLFTTLYRQPLSNSSTTLHENGKEFGEFVRVLALRLLGECVGHRVQYISPDAALWDLAEIKFMEKDPYSISLLMINAEADQFVQVELSHDKLIPTTKTSEILIPTKHGVGTLISLQN